jgi:hypothetical protein
VYRLHIVTHRCLRILHERLDVSGAFILAANVFKIAKLFNTDGFITANTELTEIQNNVTELLL